MSVFLQIDLSFGIGLDDQRRFSLLSITQEQPYQHISTLYNAQPNA